ncbi:MAG: HAMP domain-containing histidine kinase, partial [Bacteroidia bacterium]|nr:HAMP domain-containing histidine kinase [Bacteroidia bacterium]
KILEINTDLDRFLYSVSHELRTPICNGLGLVNLIRSVDDKKLINEIADKLEASIQSQDALLQKIGMYTQIVRQDIVYEQINLQSLLDNCLSALSDTEGFAQVSFRTKIQNDHPVLSNRKSLEILLTNLISNAIKFRRHTGALAVIEIKGSEEDFRIKVSDNGRGIDRKYLNDIFKVFYKANIISDGQGLGLYLVSKIVETLNGTIHVDSDLGAGAKFEVVFPTRKLE